MSTPLRCLMFYLVLPKQGLPPSRFREGDMYQTSYSLGHRKFSRDEQADAGSAFWDRERRSRPWLQEPVTAAAAAKNSAFELECREARVRCRPKTFSKPT